MSKSHIVTILLSKDWYAIIHKTIHKKYVCPAHMWGYNGYIIIWSTAEFLSLLQLLW